MIYLTRMYALQASGPLYFLFSVNFEKADGPDNYLLHPMYVNNSGNLHGSNRLLHLKSKRSEFTDLHGSNHDFMRPKKVKPRVYADAVRIPVRRSNSFDALSSPKFRKIRPKSLCSSAYYPEEACH